MNTVFRVLAATGAASVVPLALAGPAQATTQNHDSGYGWVRVCQKIHNFDHDRDYWGDYGIRDSSHRHKTVTLGGRAYDCETTRVKTGWTKVYVIDFPSHASFDRHQDDSYWFKVRKGDTYTVTFSYHARGNSKNWHEDRAA